MFARDLSLGASLVLFLVACGGGEGGDGDGGDDGGTDVDPCQSDADCSDDVFCNGDERCDAGSCVAGTAPACDDGVGCTVDSCDVASDACASVPDDAACDDGRSCNGPERCDPVQDCLVEKSPECDDGIDCTDDTCDDVGGCAHTAHDERCDDAVYCNGAETCEAGGCTDGAPPVCDDGVACTRDTCDTDLDACVAAPDDGACDDDLACNGTETCDALADCRPGVAPDCDDGVPCTVDGCDDDAGCTHDPDDDYCSNDDACDGRETCDPIADCLDSDPPDCDDRGACSIDDCDPLVGCTHVADDSVCDDGSYCNGIESCTIFDGTAYCEWAAPNCDDGDGCTDDSCDVDSDSCLHVMSPGFDADGDGYFTDACVLGDDCADGNGAIHPGMLETCNGVDDDCIGGVDDTCIANDSCADAPDVSHGGAIVGDTTGYANDVTSACEAGAGAGPDAVFQLTLAGDTVVDADLRGASYDTIVSIRDDCPGASIDCDDDSCGAAQSRLAVALDAGTYYLVIDGPDADDFGAYSLALTMYPIDATRIDADGAFEGNSCEGADEQQGCIGLFSPEDVFFFLECDGDHDVTATTCGTGWDTAIYLRQESLGDAWLICDDDSPCPGDPAARQSTFTTSVGEGLYFLTVDGFLGQCGDYTLAVTLDP